MKKLSLILLVFWGSFGFSATKNGYDLKIDLSLNGKLIYSPHVVTLVGETATVTQKVDAEQNFLEVTATEGEIQGHKGILMKFVVGTITADGQKTILSKPEILANENEPAKITIGNSHGKNIEVSLSVLAKRKTL